MKNQTSFKKGHIGYKFWKGKTFSEEHRRKIGLASKGRKCSEETKIKMREIHKTIGAPWLFGKKASISTRKKLSELRKRDKNNQWKGGRFIRHGYVFILNPEHPFATKSGYIREHRLVMEKKIGRFLQPNEVVHHINGNRQDNRVENLQLFDKPLHDSLESKKRWLNNQLVFRGQI